MDPDPSSSKTLSRAAKCLSDCNSQHNDCEPHNTPLPLRVLDVSPTSDPSIVALREFPTETHETDILLSVTAGVHLNISRRPEPRSMKESMGYIFPTSLKHHKTQFS
jgi:hypothetical protein